MPVQCKGIEACIYSGSSELKPEGVFTNADHTEATCWIASEQAQLSQEFSVRWQRSRQLGKGTFSGRVEVDGEQCGGLIMEQTVPRAHWFVKSGLETSQDTIRSFNFAKVELTDDDALLDASQNIGEICLSVWRVQILETNNEYRSSHEERKVHERSKKLTTHRVKLGEEVETEPTKSSVVEIIGDAPLVKITFKYRPRELLVAEGIISTSEEAKPAAQRNINAQAGPSNVKREASDPAPARQVHKTGP
ncbi:hypothetical protein HWV62_16518 [Athelia sp. TMB]|nr:hypothetical protein HWV62_16518 [Athelia sp. TMB]